MRTYLFLFLSLVIGTSLHAQQRQAVPLAMSHPISAAPAQDNAVVPHAVTGEIKVLAVMVEFLEDSDSRTSGTGKFGTIYPTDYGAEILDPFPHDRAYFENHLEFLRNYVWKASGGVATVTTTIMDNIVTVPGKIQDYSTVRSETNKPIADFTVAAWTAADAANPGFDFSAYDMFVIFHAGRGQDVDLTSIQGSNPTPFDLPSLSFTLDAFKLFYGDDYEGIPVSGGNFHIPNTSVLPTTNNREISLITGDRALLELTINGLLAASFGTYAGLPDLFDTETGRTGIGRFGLMDAESIFAYGGICPPAPSAWEKVRLGWATPRQAQAGTNEELLTAQRSDGSSLSDIIQVPMTGGEYWLLENRDRDPGGNGQIVTMINSGTRSSKTFDKDTTSFQNGDVTALSGVIVDVEDLDWSLPGGTVIVNDQQLRGINGGILIWHIDESIIEANLSTNKVNANPKLRGVDLEQAGGAQDIGETISSIFGDEVASGSALDYWFSGNIAPLYENVFGANTYPNTRANNGAFSHVSIRDFSTAGPLMSVVISIGDDVIAPLAGYPLDLGATLPVDSVTAFVQTADITGGGEHVMLVAASGSEKFPADTGYVFGLATDGTNFYTGSYAYRIITESGITRWYGAPLVADITGDAVAEIIVYGKTANNERVSVYSTNDINMDGLSDFMYSFEFGSAHTASVVPAIRDGKLVVYMPYPSGTDTLFVCGSAIERFPVNSGGMTHVAHNAIGVIPGSDVVVSANDETAGLLNIDQAAYDAPKLSFLPNTGMPQTSMPQMNCAVSDFDGDNVYEAAAFTVNGLYILSSPSDTKTVTSGRLPASMNVNHYPAHLSSMDVDGDDRNDIIVSDGNRILVYNYALASSDFYPATFGAEYTLGVRVAGEDRDQMFAVGDRHLSQIVTGAKQADGFPVPLPADASVTLFPYGAGTQHLAIATIGKDGKLYVFETGNEVDENSFVWRSRYGGETNANFAPGKGSAGAPIADFFPQDRCYNWPNPAYDAVTKFRFYVSVDASVAIKIYDLAGDKVDALHMQAVGGVDNEIDWNVAGIESGVYVAHIKAEGGGQTGEKIIKVAVVK